MTGLLSLPADTTGAAAAAEPAFIDAKRIREVLSSVGVEPRRGPADAVFEDAMHSYKNKLYTAPIPSFQRALELYPGHALATAYLATSKAKAGTAEDLTGKEGGGLADEASGPGGLPGWLPIVLAVVVVLAVLAAVLLALMRRRAGRFDSDEEEEEEEEEEDDGKAPVLPPVGRRWRSGGTTTTTTTTTIRAGAQRRRQGAGPAAGLGGLGGAAVHRVPCATWSAAAPARAATSARTGGAQAVGRTGRLRRRQEGQPGQCGGRRRRAAAWPRAQAR